MRKTLVVVVLFVLAVVATGFGQRWRYRMPPKFPTEAVEHRAFTFSRILYESDRREPGGQGWYTDYPTADQNLMIRLSEMTTTKVGFDKYDEPDHVVLRLTDEKLFDYPFIFMSDVGTLWLDDLEITCERAGFCGLMIFGGLMHGHSG